MIGLLLILFFDKPYDYRHVISPVLTKFVSANNGMWQLDFKPGHHHLIDHPVQLVVFDDPVQDVHFTLMPTYHKDGLFRGKCVGRRGHDNRLVYVEVRYDEQAGRVTVKCLKLGVVGSRDVDVGVPR